ncbi:MAG: hypothetical protein Q8T08_07180 [Ignavibacteria bacterium]|nr:hypothetical protein [Ignavibacteria bacterium]
MAEIKTLLELLAVHGGEIVSTGCLSIDDIEQARASDRMYVDENSLGYIWMPNFQKFPETEAEVDFFEKWYPLEIEVPKNLNDRMENKLKEFLQVSDEVSSFICPRNKGELSINEKHEHLLRELLNDAILK